VMWMGQPHRRGCSAMAVSEPSLNRKLDCGWINQPPA
jgi:hypothetical protein